MRVSVTVRSTVVKVSRNARIVAVVLFLITMSYWTKKRKVNAAVAQQLAELSDDYSLDRVVLYQYSDCATEVSDRSTVSVSCTSTNKDLLGCSTSYANFSEGVMEGNSNDVLLDTGTENEELVCFDCGELSDESSECELHDNDVDSVDACGGLVDKLAQWRAKHSITLDAMSDLLDILRPQHPKLPKDPRTLMKNVDYSEIADKICNVSGGMYYHFGC